MTETLASQARRTDKRVEITATNVHTSIGKLLCGVRVSLPKDEALHLIERDQAISARGRTPSGTPGKDAALTLDIGGMHRAGPALEAGELTADELPDSVAEQLQRQHTESAT